MSNEPDAQFRERVTVAVDHAGVADVRLIRSAKMNAMDDDMFAALAEAVEWVGAQPSVRAVVLSGEGRAFCAGLDMGNFSRPRDERRPALTERPDDGPVSRGQAVVWGWRELPVPVIAAVHGVAFGAGFQLALAGDVRIVHPDTQMSVMEIRWGLIPDMAGTAIMRNLAREDVVRELTYTGRRISGTEAAELGFATRTADDPYAEALALAGEMAGQSPDAIAFAKSIFNRAPDATDLELLRMEAELQGRLAGSSNQREAVASNLENRPAAYGPRQA